MKEKQSMTSAVDKIKKAAGSEPTAIELAVAQEIFNLEVLNHSIALNVVNMSAGFSRRTEG